MLGCSGGRGVLGPVRDVSRGPVMHDSPRQHICTAHLTASPAYTAQLNASSAATECFSACGCISHGYAKNVCCGGRRLTVPLTASGEATMSKLMKDDDEYTFSELPRINPRYKVCRKDLLILNALQFCNKHVVHCYLGQCGSCSSQFCTRPSVVMACYDALWVLCHAVLHALLMFACGSVWLVLLAKCFYYFSQAVIYIFSACHLTVLHGVVRDKLWPRWWLVCRQS